MPNKFAEEKIVKSFQSLRWGCSLNDFHWWLSATLRSWGLRAYYRRALTNWTNRERRTETWNIEDKDRYSYRSSSLKTGMEDGSSRDSTIKPLLELRSQNHSKCFDHSRYALLKASARRAASRAFLRFFNSSKAPCNWNSNVWCWARSDTKEKLAQLPGRSISHSQLGSVSTTSSCNNNNNNNNNFIYPFDWQNIKRYKDRYKKYQRVWLPKITVQLKNLEANNHIKLIYNTRSETHTHTHTHTHTTGTVTSGNTNGTNV